MAYRTDIVHLVAQARFETTPWCFTTRHRASVSAAALKAVLWVIWHEESEPLALVRIAQLSGLADTTAMMAITLLRKMGVVRMHAATRPNSYRIDTDALRRFMVPEPERRAHPAKPKAPEKPCPSCGKPFRSSFRCCSGSCGARERWRRRRARCVSV